MDQSSADHGHLLLPSPDVFDQYFPNGLKLLIVGMNDTDEAIIRRELPNPYYHISTYSTAAKAIEILGLGCFRYDLVISDVSLPDMDGLHFIRRQHSTTNIPHVAIYGVERSSKTWAKRKERSSEILTAFEQGACYVLWKPLTTEGQLRNLWQHVCRRRYECKTNFKNNNGDHVDDNNQQHSSSPSLVSNSKGKSPIVAVGNHSKHVNHVGEPSSKRQRRIVWTRELHDRFLRAVNLLGGSQDAVPKKILEHMNLSFLTRENVASHLQKYRISLKKAEEKLPYENMNGMPTNRMSTSISRETSYERFDNNNNNNGALPHISRQPVVSIRHPDMLIYHTPQNPNSPHLQETSTSNSLPYHQSHFPVENFLQSRYRHLACQQMQMQPPLQKFNFGCVAPLTKITPSLPRKGSNMNLASGSSGIVNMQQLDQTLAFETSRGGNMQQQQHVNQNQTSDMQQLNQNLASGSCHATTNLGNDDGILKPEATLTIRDHDEEFHYVPYDEFDLMSICEYNVDKSNNLDFLGSTDLPFEHMDPKSNTCGGSDGFATR